ncbi:hypothetical protein IAT38_002362 [Cryptococcus sp. DSM 104549]
MPADVVVISSDEEDNTDISFVGISQPAGPPKSAAIFIDSDSDAGIETDNDAFEDLYNFTKVDMATTKSTATVTAAASRSTSASASTSGSGLYGPGRIISQGTDWKGKGRATIAHADSILSKLDFLSRATPAPSPSPSPPPLSPRMLEQSYTGEKPVTKRKSSGDAAAEKKRPKARTAVETADQELSRHEKEALKIRQREEKEAAKLREKDAKQLMRDTAKAAKEAEKSLKKKLADVNKLHVSKNDALREIKLYLSNDLEHPASPIAGALPEIKGRITDNLSSLSYLSSADSPIPGTIRFKRHIKAQWDPKDKLFRPLENPRWAWEPTVLVIITAEELVDKIAYGQDELSVWASDVRLALGLNVKDQMVVMIKGLQKYYSKLVSLERKEYMAAARAGLEGTAHAGRGAEASRSRPSKEVIEAEMVRLQVADKCFLVHVDSTEDIEDWIFNISADIAIRPHKLLSKSHLNFCATDGIRKGSTPTSILELMLQEVQGITPSASQGIAAEYPTFRDLMESFEEAERRGGAPRGEAMLEDCQVNTTRDGRANGRKLNKALARRIYNVFRGTDSLALA